MISESTVAEFMQRYLLLEGESVVDSSERDGGVTVSTDKRREFSVRSELDRWIVGRESWITDIIMATREDIHVHGQPERFAFLLPDGGNLGDEVYVNDPTQLAELGRQIPDGIDPVAFAELLVQFHPYTSALRTLLLRADDLRTMFALEHLPDVIPFTADTDDQGTRLTFASCVRYRPPASYPQLDIVEWEVTVPAGQPAHWSSQLVAEELPLIEQ